MFHCDLHLSMRQHQAHYQFHLKIEPNISHAQIQNIQNLQTSHNKHRITHNIRTSFKFRSKKFKTFELLTTVKRGFPLVTII